MTELQRYLAEEVAEDHADGIITRREAMRRLGLLGVGTTVATSMLASFAAAAGAAPAAESAAPDIAGTSTPWGPVARQAVTFRGPEGRTLMGLWAPAAKPNGGVLVIHENRGLTDHIGLVAGRLAGSGYSALALDLLSAEGGTRALGDEGRVSATLSQVPEERFIADMKAAVTELRRRLPRRRLAAIGFCFGGGMVWRLLASGEPRLAAATPFYGPFPEGGSLSGSRAAVLAVYGGLDNRVNASMPVAKRAMRAANLRNETLTFTGADHAFFNETGARYNPSAAAEAYRRIIAWYDRYLGTTTG